MATRTHLAALLAAALLAGSPAVAVAQTPGDEQYQDPFGDQVPQDEATPESERDTEASQNEDQDDPEPLQGTPPGIGEEPAEPEPAEEPEPSQPAAEAQPSQSELPNTGAEAGLIGLAGFGMVLCGTGLRLRLRPHGERPA